MTYTLRELERLLGQLMTAARAGEEIIIERDGKPIAQLIPGGLGLKPRTTGRLAGKIAYKGPHAPIRSRELSDLGFEL